MDRPANVAMRCLTPSSRPEEPPPGGLRRTRVGGARAYYAHPQNRFWSALHASGLTPRKLKLEEHLIAAMGPGLTHIAKHVSGMDRELPPGASAARPAPR